MSHRAFTLLLALVCLAACAAPAHAFDGKRKGFLLGAGVGAGASSFTQTLEVSGFGSETSDRETKFGFATDFRIGWGINDQFLLYYDNRVNWFSITNVFDESVTIADGLSSLAVSYFLQPSMPSAFFTGGIGFAGWATPFEEASGSLSGFGLFAGGGYEFNKVLSLEATLSFATPSDEDGGVKLTTDSVGFRLMLLIMGY